MFNKYQLYFLDLTGNLILFIFKPHNMKKFGIILAIVGIVMLIAGNFFYKHTINAVDSSGSSIITTVLNGGWTFKLPVFAGGALFFLGFVFWAASRTDNQHHDHLI